MNINSLKPASSLVQRLGVKALVYGQPGLGKTPIAATSPRPVFCAVEPGMLSLRNSNIPVWEAFTVERINEFFNWFFESKEANNFDTLCVDSVSQMAEIILTAWLKKRSDGRAAYGGMSIDVMSILNRCYYMQNKHMYLIAKKGENDAGFMSPFFPGKDLNVKVPHLFDEVLFLNKETVPGIAIPQTAFRTVSSYNALARDRTGNLAELEPPDLTALFAKAMR